MKTPPPSKRAPAVAGRFYPADTGQLGDCVKRYLEEAAERAPAPATCKAVVAPHAGYVFSGSVAGSAFGPWAAGDRSETSSVSRVVVIGPSHYVDFHGLALPESGHFETPLGLVEVDQEAVSLLKPFSFVNPFQPAHLQEHAIEVELPFLQLIFPWFRLVPLVIGRATDQEVGAVVDRLWGGAETRFVMSSDLSHYLNAEAASARDRQTAEAIEAGRYERLTSDRACGFKGIRGLMGSRSGRRLPSRCADLRHSGDAGGPMERVVGYGAFHFGAGERD